MDNKVCRVCKIEKILSDFYSNNYSADGYAYECKACHLVAQKKYRNENPDKIKSLNKSQYSKNREKRLAFQKRWAAENKDRVKDFMVRWKAKNPEYSRKATLKKHNLTEIEFNKMWIGQVSTCWICSEKFKKKSDAHIDHCHNSKTIRGLLCSCCNTALGLVKESEKTLNIMIHYLKNNIDGWKEF